MHLVFGKVLTFIGEKSIIKNMKALAENETFLR